MGIIPFDLLTHSALAAPAGLLLVIAVIILGIGMIIALPRLQVQLTRILFALSWPGPDGKARLISLLEKFLLGLRSLSSFRQAVAFTLLTLLIWGMDGLGMVFLAWTFSLEISLSQAMVLLAGLGLASTIPSTPGSVGIYQFVAILILEPMGYNREMALAFILVAQAVGYLVVLTWGGLATLRYARRFA
jgi:hypothetical protein